MSTLLETARKRKRKKRRRMWAALMGREERKRLARG
jgi:hypothetical protein